MKTCGAVQQCVGVYNEEGLKPMSGMVAQKEDALHEGTVQAISDLFENKLEDKVTGYKVPDVGDYVLVNECVGCFTRVHGGRPEFGLNRRYFGRVTQRYPYIIVMETKNGITSEKVSDIKVGLVRYVSLKCLPEYPEELTYDEKLLSNFIRDFENLLLE